MKKNRAGLFTMINHFLRDLRGVSAVEFAFVFPVMALLFLGGTAMTQGLVIKRKVAMATRIVGDLVSQDTQVIDNERDSIFNAATAVLQPYPTGQLGIIVSSVIIDAAGAAKIDWSDATSNATAHPKNATVTLPAGITPVDANGLAVAGSTIIWVEGNYAYTLPVGSEMLGTTALNLADQFYLRPRRVTAIKRCTTGVCT